MSRIGVSDKTHSLHQPIHCSDLRRLAAARPLCEFRPWSFACKTSEDSVKYPEPAPSDEAVVQGLVATVALRRILPLQTIADDVDDAAHHPPIIDTRHPVSPRKMRRNPCHLGLAQQKQLTHQGLLHRKPRIKPATYPQWV